MTKVNLQVIEIVLYWMHTIHTLRSIMRIKRCDYKPVLHCFFYQLNKPCKKEHLPKIIANLRKTVPCKDKTCIACYELDKVEKNLLSLINKHPYTEKLNIKKYYNNITRATRSEKVDELMDALLIRIENSKY